MSRELDAAIQWIAYARRELARGDLRAADTALERAANYVGEAKAKK